VRGALGRLRERSDPLDQCPYEGVIVNLFIGLWGQRRLLNHRCQNDETGRGGNRERHSFPLKRHQLSTQSLKFRLGQIITGLHLRQHCRVLTPNLD
jgi:hypothetical protein